MSDINITLKVWRQASTDSTGNFESYGMENINSHMSFLELLDVLNEKLIKVKVWERGAGLTKACGTAACATAIAANINNLIKNKTDVEFELGKLSIFIDTKDSIHMKGPVSNIEKIKIKL